MRHIFSLMILLGSVLSFHATAWGIIVTQNNNAGVLSSSFAGRGITIVGTPTFAGNAAQAGTYTSSGLGGSGVVLSTGNVNSISGVQSNYLSTDFGGAGDSDIETLIPAYPGVHSGVSPSFDASVLEFDFQIAPGSTGALFSFFFANDEPQGLAFDQTFNDGALAVLDGQNIAFNTLGNSPTSLQMYFDYGYNLNSPPSPPNGINPLGNSAISDTGFWEYEPGMAAGTLGIGSIHHLKLAIADGGDGLSDSALFLPGGSFVATPAPVPIPGAALLFGSGLAALGAWRHRNNKKS